MILPGPNKLTRTIVIGDKTLYMCDKLFECVMTHMHATCLTIAS